MKKQPGVIIALLCVLSVFIGCSKQHTNIIKNPLSLNLGDLFLLHASGGKYYMCGTSLADGFEAFVSEDLKTWDSCGQIYTGGTAKQWNKGCSWAPEVYERNGKYYLFYCANAKENPTNELEIFKIGVAVSDSPTGPFRDLINRPISNPPYPIIDASVYFGDENNKCYLYYSRCCYKHPVESEIADKARKEGKFDEVEESWVYGVESKPDFASMIGEPKLLLAPPTKLDDQQSEWESESVTPGEVNQRWTEGPYIFKHDGLYYMMYSASLFEGAHYAIEYATVKNPLGPFKKAENNPVLQEDVSKGGTMMGTGHNMLITMPGGKMYTVYHARMQADPLKHVVFMDQVAIQGGKLKANGPTTNEQEIAY